MKKRLEKNIKPIRAQRDKQVQVEGMISIMKN